MSTFAPSVENFPNCKSLIEYVRALCASNGYSISIARSKKHKVYLGCDRAGKYRNRLNLTNETHQKNTSSRLIDCSFSVCGIKQKDNSWTLSIREPLYNHDPSENLLAHPSCQKLNEQAQEQLSEMSIAGSNPSILATSRDIYNVRKKFRLENLQGSNLTFFVCFIFLKDEKEEDYEWALAQVSRLFDGIEQPKDTWIPLKKQFVGAWINDYLHLGNVTTSRIESSHAVLKKYLQFSTGNLHTVYEKITLLLEHQHNEIKAIIAKDKIRTFHTHNIPFYARVINKVSSFSLNKVHEQFIKASHTTLDNPLTSCKGTFNASIGLPCAHIIQERLAANQLLSLDDFHKHWWIENYHQLPLQPEKNSLPQLIEELNLKYISWPVFQQLVAQDTLSRLIGESSTSLLDPIVQRTRGQPI
ncbi:8130_t:CDS:2, partial [Racocetra fulgida]